MEPSWLQESEPARISTDSSSRSNQRYSLQDKIGLKKGLNFYYSFVVAVYLEDIERGERCLDIVLRRKFLSLLGMTISRSRQARPEF